MQIFDILLLFLFFAATIIRWWSSCLISGRAVFPAQNTGKWLRQEGRKLFFPEMILTSLAPDLNKFSSPVSAVFLSLQEEFAQAVECYTKCIELFPNKTAPYTNRALCNLKLGKVCCSCCGKKISSRVEWNFESVTALCTLQCCPRLGEPLSSHPALFAWARDPPTLHTKHVAFPLIQCFVLSAWSCDLRLQRSYSTRTDQRESAVQKGPSLQGTTKLENFPSKPCTTNRKPAKD